MARNHVGGSGKPASDDDSLASNCNEELNSLSRLKLENMKGGFGEKVAQIRILLGQTQKSLADMLLTSRQSIVALESCDNVNKLSDGMLFRTYYFVKELSENKFVPSLIVSISNDLLKEITQCIVEKATKN